MKRSSMFELKYVISVYTVIFLSVEQHIFK